MQACHKSRRPLPDAELLTASPSGSWHEWLGRIAIAARSGPVVVVLDEFPWMAAADTAVEGELQAVWDRTLEKLPVLLILVGSDVAMMERLSEHGRPLFGRLQPLVVGALNPAEIAEALPGRTAFEVSATADTSAVLGGIRWRSRGGVSSREIEDLRRARDRVPRSADARLAAISPHGERPAGADLAFSAQDLLEAWR